MCLALAIAISEGARRRRDARLLLIGLAFVVSAGFLGLHALATPTVFIAGKNAGFVLATPVGLILAGCFAAASAVEYRLETSLWIVRHGRLLLGLVLLVIVVWAVVSLGDLPPLHDADRTAGHRRPARRRGGGRRRGSTAYAAFAYFRVYHRRRSGLAFAVAFAFALLAEALVVALLSLTTSWQLSWWEWHGLMLIGFVAIGVAAAREWYEERFSALYLDETLRGNKEVSVLFADLAGFTPFTEARGSDRGVRHARRVLRAARADDPGRVRRRGARVRRRPDLRGLQQGGRPAGPRAARRPGRARAPARRARDRRRPSRLALFRVGVNTGEVLAGVVGDRGHRIHGVFGDAVNLGARLEGQRACGRRADRRRHVRAAPTRSGRGAHRGPAGQGQVGAGRRLRPARAAVIFESLDYVYVPTDDVAETAQRYVDDLGAELVWRVRGMGTVVACLRVSGDGPAILLSGHLEGPTPILVYRVADYDAAISQLRDAGAGELHELEIPQGPCASFRMPGGQRLAIYELRRPGAADHFIGRVDD